MDDASPNGSLPEILAGTSRSERFFAFPRSTFCSIIAQLTEETQPLFETTLKSRAVSEDSDVRFTCIVTGNEALWRATPGPLHTGGPKGAVGTGLEGVG